MFQLIVAVISIVLVAAMALAATYYGGDVFVSARTRTMAQALLEQSSQIKSAYVLYKVEHGTVPTMDDLVTAGYLKPTFFPYAGFGTASVQGRWDIQNWNNPTNPIWVVVISADGIGSFDRFKEVCDQGKREVGADLAVRDLRGHGIVCDYNESDPANKIAVFARHLEGWL